MADVVANETRRATASRVTAKWPMLQYLLDVAAVGLFVGTLYSLQTHRKFPQSTKRAYVCRNVVTHARFLPEEAKHAFTYPTLALLLSLDALEKKELDLVRGWIFGYGGLFGRLTGMRPSAYLRDNDRSIRQKLEDALKRHGHDPARLSDAWVLTMPSYLGFEGINPLTVYYCYDTQDLLWIIVLEVHNTFGERHVYVLEVGNTEDECKMKSFEHQWSFPRQFHVSPFNDRSGYYTCYFTSPPHSPNQIPPELPPSKGPIVKVDLFTNATPRQLKLTALLRPISMVPLTTSSLLGALASTPFALLVSLPRIVYQAWILHYRKRLAVYARPEPASLEARWESTYRAGSNAIQDESLGGGVGWQREGFFERWARRHVYAHLSRQTTSVALVPTDPSDSPKILLRFGPDGKPEGVELTIHYRSPRFFILLLRAPDVETMLALGESEGLFSVSSREIFKRVFSPTRESEKASIAQRVRMLPLGPKDCSPRYARNPLDDTTSSVKLMVVLIVLFVIEQFERWIFTFLDAEFVSGDEPWGMWSRIRSPRTALGSTLRTD